MSLQMQVFWACCGIIPLLAAAYGGFAACSIMGLNTAAAPERLSLLWHTAVLCWLAAVPPIWFIARLESRRVVRRIQEPIGTLVRQCQEIREGRAAPPLRCSGNDAELESLITTLNEILRDYHGFIFCQQRFAADAAHELRTPLTAQMVVGENALARRCSSEELREVVGSMLEESKHMRRLIDSLLELARASIVAKVGDNNPARAPMPVELARLARSCVDSLQVLAEEKGQRLELDAAFVWVDADITLIRQALLNVVHNAIEHCPEGACIQVATDRVSRDQARIRVSDNGPGIPLEHQPHVFKRFYRAPSQGMRRGFGLGLSIAEALLKSQRGQIHLAHSPGGGCCFILTLPLLPEPSQQQTVPSGSDHVATENPACLATAV